MVPDGWRVATYGEVAEINRETISSDTAPDTIIDYLDIGSVLGPGRIDTSKQILFAEAPSRARRRVRAGDTIVSTVRPSRRAIAYLANPAKNLVVSTGFAVLTPIAGINPEFLYQTTLRSEFTAELVKRQTGSNYPAVRPAEIADLQIFIPSAAEQGKIVSILSSVDRILRDTEAVIDALRHTRKTLLEDLFKQPTNEAQWQFCSLSELCSKIVDGVHHKPSYVPEGIPFVTVKNLTSGDGISFSDVNYITKQDHLRFVKRADPGRGDVLLSKDGTLGVPRVVETEQPFSIFVSVALLRPKRELIDSYFLRYALEARIIASQFMLARAGSALKHIHLVDLRRTKCPLPPLEKQKNIAQVLRGIDERIMAEHNYTEQLGVVRHSLANALLSGHIRVVPEGSAS